MIMLRLIDFLCHLDVSHMRLEKMYGALIRFLVFVRTSIVPMPFLLLMLKPDMPIFVTSLIYSTKSPPSLLARVMHGLPMIYLAITWWSNAFFMIAWLLGYVFSTLVAIHNLR